MDKADDIGLDAMVRERQTETACERKYREIYDAFTVAAGDEEEMFVEYAFAAQAEVVLGDEDGEYGVYPPR